MKTDDFSPIASNGYNGGWRWIHMVDGDCEIEHARRNHRGYGGSKGHHTIHTPGSCGCHCSMEFSHPAGYVPLSEDCPHLLTISSSMWENWPCNPHWKYNHSQALTIHAVLRSEVGRARPAVLPTRSDPSSFRR